MDENKILTVYNHLNDEENQHPRYENFPTFLSNTFATTGGFKIFDSVVQLDSSQLNEQDRTISLLSFSALIQDVSSDSNKVDKVLLDVNFRPKQSGDGVVASVSCNPITHTHGELFYSVLFYKKLTDSPTRTYQVQVYLYTIDTYTKIRVTFLDFYSDLWHMNGIANRYGVDGSSFYSKYKRIKKFLGDNIANNIQIVDPDGTFTAIDSRIVPYHEMTHTNNTSMTISPETEKLYFGASTDVSVDTIVFDTDMSKIAKKKNIRLLLVFYNGHTTLVNTGTFDDSNTNKICLKGGVNVNPTTKGQTILLDYNGVKWQEIARNF
jgi:hypothetical protein